MENKETKKVDACCKCCPEGCTCGDCACCKEWVTNSKSCCSNSSSCCNSACMPKWCPCCSRTRSYCRLCNVGRLIFRFLVIVALWNIAFGGGMRYKGRGMMWEGCGCGMNGWSAVSGQMNCMWMKDMKEDGWERKWWFNRGGKDSDDKTVSWSVVVEDIK